MSGSVMGFGPEDWTDLIDPLEYTDQHLFVELRALGEVGVTPEVVDGEDVRARFGCRADELRRLDLGESQSVEGRPESGHRGRGDRECSTLARVPQQIGRA